MGGLVFFETLYKNNIFEVVPHFLKCQVFVCGGRVEYKGES